MAERQSGLPERLAASAQLFAPATLLAPSVERLSERLHGGLVPAGEDDILELASRVRGQCDSTRAAAGLLNANGSKGATIAELAQADRTGVAGPPG
jgi:hypothetical protein